MAYLEFLQARIHTRVVSRGQNHRPWVVAGGFQLIYDLGELRNRARAVDYLVPLLRAIAHLFLARGCLGGLGASSDWALGQIEVWCEVCGGSCGFLDFGLASMTAVSLASLRCHLVGQPLSLLLALVAHPGQSGTEQGQGLARAGRALE